MPKFDVTIAGEINLDIILYGLPEDLPLERELLADGCAVTLGSSSAITAHNLSMLGSHVGFVTRVGRDSLGEIALGRLQTAGVDISKITHSTGSDTGLTIVLQHAPRRHMLTYPGCMAEMRYEDLDLAYLTSARHFHLSSFFLHRALRDRIPELFRQLKLAGLTISFDSNDDPDDQWGGNLHEALRYVDLLMPNEREACKLAGRNSFEDALAALGEKIPTVVVKMGSRGAMAVQKGKHYQAPALAVEVVDPVGAGDTFNAGFLNEYLRGSDLPTCLASGTLAAAFSTTRAGGTEAFREAGYWQQFRQQYRVSK